METDSLGCAKLLLRPTDQPLICLPLTGVRGRPNQGWVGSIRIVAIGVPPWIHKVLVGLDHIGFGFKVTLASRIVGVRSGAEQICKKKFRPNNIIRRVEGILGALIRKGWVFRFIGIVTLTSGLESGYFSFGSGGSAMAAYRTGCAQG